MKKPEATRSDIEEQKLSAKEPAAKPKEKRVWKRIVDQERLKLKKTVGLGLPIHLAANILKINSRNANRVMAKIVQTESLER